MDDLISRQAAIDALGKAPKYKQKIIKTYAEGRNDQWFDDVAALVKLPSAQPDLDEWCDDCKEYDKDKHCCPRWNRVIRQTLEEVQSERMRGHWIEIQAPDSDGNGLYECSICHRGEVHVPIVEVPFCWHCGAQMTEGEE